MSGLKRPYSGEDSGAGPSRSKSFRAEALSTLSRDHDRSFPSFRRPSIVGRFSLDGERKIHHDSRNIKFYEKRGNAYRLGKNIKKNTLSETCHLNSKRERDLFKEYVFFSRFRSNTGQFELERRSLSRHQERRRRMQRGET